jgi:hypothetical protein
MSKPSLKIITGCKKLLLTMKSKLGGKKRLADERERLRRDFEMTRNEIYELQDVICSLSVILTPESLPWLCASMVDWVK